MILANCLVLSLLVSSTFCLFGASHFIFNIFYDITHFMMTLYPGKVFVHARKYVSLVSDIIMFTSMKWVIAHSIGDMRGHNYCKHNKIYNKEIYLIQNHRCICMFYTLSYPVGFDLYDYFIIILLPSINDDGFYIYVHRSLEDTLN
jgi:hypothetical protein